MQIHQATDDDTTEESEIAPIRTEAEEARHYHLCRRMTTQDLLHTEPANGGLRSYLKFNHLGSYRSGHDDHHLFANQVMSQNHIIAGWNYPRGTIFKLQTRRARQNINGGD